MVCGTILLCGGGNDEPGLGLCKWLPVSILLNLGYHHYYKKISLLLPPVTGKRGKLHLPNVLQCYIVAPGKIGDRWLFA